MSRTRRHRRKPPPEKIKRMTEMDEGTDAGREYFKANPELDLASVMQEASRRFGGVGNENRYWGFYDGYRAARQQHDEYQREKREEDAVKIPIEWKP